MMVAMVMIGVRLVVLFSFCHSVHSILSSAILSDFGVCSYFDILDQSIAMSCNVNYDIMTYVIRCAYPNFAMY